MKCATPPHPIVSRKHPSRLSASLSVLFAGMMLLAAMSGAACHSAASYNNGPSSEERTTPARKEASKKPMNGKTDLKLATFGSGCFWCTEAVFQRLKGVESVMPGYSGGHVENPTYEQVCSGNTGHAESIQITYNPAIVTYDALLEVFWKTHDPTTKNRQGNDVGTQYRSAVFFHDTEQKKIAESYKTRLEAEKIWDRPIVTEIVPFSKFWPAEDYHRNYYNNNPSKGYCSLVITPKIEKFKKIFKERLKTP